MSRVGTHPSRVTRDTCMLSESHGLRPKPQSRFACKLRVCGPILCPLSFPPLWTMRMGPTALPDELYRTGRLCRATGTAV